MRCATRSTLSYVDGRCGCPGQHTGAPSIATANDLNFIRFNSYSHGVVGRCVLCCMERLLLLLLPSKRLRSIVAVVLHIIILMFGCGARMFSSPCGGRVSLSDDADENDR